MHQTSHHSPLLLARPHYPFHSTPLTPSMSTPGTPRYPHRQRSPRWLPRKILTTQSEPSCTASSQPSITAKSSMDLPSISSLKTAMLYVTRSGSLQSTLKTSMTMSKCPTDMSPMPDVSPPKSPLLRQTALSRPYQLHRPSRSGASYMLQIILRTNEDIMDLLIVSYTLSLYGNMLIIPIIVLSSIMHAIILFFCVPDCCMIGLLIVPLMALSPTAPIVSKHLVLYHRHLLLCTFLLFRHRTIVPCILLYSGV